MPNHIDAGRFTAVNNGRTGAGQGALRSKRLQAQFVSRDLANRIASVRRAYFVVGAERPLWDVALDAILEQVSAEGVWSARAELWIADLALACACIRGDQIAWSELVTRHIRSLCEGAELRLTPQQSRLLVERFLRELRATTLAEAQRVDAARRAQPSNETALQDYRGGQTLARWLLAHILARVERMPLGVPMSTLSKSSSAGRRDGRNAHASPLVHAHVVDSAEVASILDSVPPPRTLASDAPASMRVPQAT